MINRYFPRFELNERIAIALNEGYLTAEEFAIMLSVTPITLKSWVKGVYCPTEDELDLIAGQSAVSVTWLYGINPKMPEMNPAVVIPIEPEQNHTSELAYELLKNQTPYELTLEDVQDMFAEGMIAYGHKCLVVYTNSVFFYPDNLLDYAKYF